jgi:IclR family transcriptional regulator, acetate operon repressor
MEIVSRMESISMSTTAVDRCLSIVEALVDESAGVSLVDLAARLEMPNSAIHRTLATLAARGYVRQDPATQAYALTLRLSTLGFRLLGARHLPDAGQLALQRLAEETGEYCRLAVVDGGGLTWIARAQGSTQGLRYEPPMGREVVLHATATGKAWLATLPEDEALRLVVARGFPVPRHVDPNMFGKGVVRSIDELRAHLRETRRRGYALAIEEGEAGTVAMAAAFRASEHPQAPVAGTVSVAGPLIRMGPARREKMAPLLAAAAGDLAALWPLRQHQAGIPRIATAPGRPPRARVARSAGR